MRGTTRHFFSRHGWTIPAVICVGFGLGEWAAAIHGDGSMLTALTLLVVMPLALRLVYGWMVVEEPDVTREEWLAESDPRRVR